MAKQDTECGCGEKVTVLSGDDANLRFRSDGKQVIYKDEPTYDGSEYDIFRCRNCGEPIAKSCKAAEYEK